MVRIRRKAKRSKRPQRKVRRKRLKLLVKSRLLWGAVGLSLVVHLGIKAWAFEYPMSTGHGRSGRASGNPIFSLRGDTAKEVTFSFLREDKTYPTLTLLTKNPFQRIAAKKVNKEMKRESKIAAVQQAIDENAEKIDFSFEGLRLQQAKKGEVRISLVSGPREFQFPQKIKLTELESGRPVELKGTVDKEKDGDVATTVMRITVTYDATTGKITLAKVSGDVIVTPKWGLRLQDSASLPEDISGAKGRVNPKDVVSLLELNEDT